MHDVVLSLTAVISHSLTDVFITTIQRDGITVVNSLLVGSAAQQEKTACKNRMPEPTSGLSEIADKITAYLDGAVIDFSSVPLDTGGGSGFRNAVLAVARTIPYGVTVSYGELAKMAGFPGAARAVGSVMRSNAFPILIPCHRVIRSDGKAGGYCGSQSGKDVLLKQRLMALEAVGNRSD
ncbi:MAG: methylated-DNA--[protein]-cysteine S-methyltransferase [Chitinispirillaceae bacterium]|nr:methylated-DNA--[protein]-cysteine S-methyltransferase [Chitinispirillaceae bacterium]